MKSKTLFYTNKECNNNNLQQIDSFKSNYVILLTLDRNKNIINFNNKDRDFKNIKNKEHKILKIGCPVILTETICKKSVIVNNATGILFDV